MTQATTSATYKTLVTANLPDFGSRDITFRLVAAFFNAAGEEVIDGKTYTMTLDASGVDDGSFYLPTPDNTGATGANWFVTLPSGYEDIVTVAYSGAAQAVSDLLAAGSTTTDPDVITAALAGKVNRSGDTMSGSLTGYFLQHTTIPAGETITIPATAQLIVAGGITVDGTLVQDGPLVVIPDDALSAANDLSDLDSAATARTNLGLGTAALSATGDFDAAGAAETAQAAAVQRANHTGTQLLATISDAGTMAAQATTSYYAKTDFSASPTAAEPLKANGSGGLTLNSSLYVRTGSSFVIGLRSSDGVELFSFANGTAVGIANVARIAGASGAVLGRQGTTTNYLFAGSVGTVISNSVPEVTPSALLTLTHSATTAQAVEMRIASSTTANTQAARIGWAWIDSTHATRKAALTLYASDSGGERTGVTVGADGTGATIGFYGVTATARQLLATGAGASVDDVITALQTLGLVKQS